MTETGAKRERCDDPVGPRSYLSRSLSTMDRKQSGFQGLRRGQMRRGLQSPRCQDEGWGGRR